jgi:hypothetical protein
LINVISKQAVRTKSNYKSKTQMQASYRAKKRRKEEGYINIFLILDRATTNKNRIFLQNMLSLNAKVHAHADRVEPCSNLDR